MADTTFGDRLEAEYLQGRISLDTQPELPAVPLPTPDLASVVRSLKALKTVVEAIAGRSSTAYDKALTLRDLVDSGMVAIRIGGQVVGTGTFNPPGTGGPIVVPTDPTGPGYIDPRPILLVPPTPTSVTAVGAFRNVIVAWKLFAYKNHAYCEVWRASTNNLALAARHGTTTANIYIDGTGLSGATYYYWVRAVNTEGALGQFQSTSGIAATLGLLVDDDVPPQFIKHAMIGLLAVDDANIADLNAGKINAGFMSADRIEANSLHGNKITVNTLSGDRLLANTITAGKINGLDLKVYSGYYTDWDFPATAGLGGFYLGPEGLRMGSYLSNRYFEVLANGDIRAPGLTISSGSASFSGSLAAGTSISAPVITGGSISGTTVSGVTVSGSTINGTTINSSSTLNGVTGTFSGTLTASAVNAVNAINLAGGAVNVTDSNTGTTASISASITVPSGKTWKVICMGWQDGYDQDSTFANNTTVPLTINGVSVALMGITVDIGSSSSVYRKYIQAGSVATVATVVGPATFSPTLEGTSGVSKTIVLFGAPT